MHLSCGVGATREHSLAPRMSTLSAGAPLVKRLETATASETGTAGAHALIAIPALPEPMKSLSGVTTRTTPLRHE